MSKIALVTDSTCSIPKDLVEKYEIIVAPQILIWGNEILEDGVDIMPSEFYRRLAKTSVIPSTSQVTVSKFLEIYQRLLDQDHQIMTIVLSSKLSGTLNSAIQAKAMLPSRSSIPIPLPWPWVSTCWLLPVPSNREPP
jgi:DegV family protein with EDD domain